MAIPPGYEIQVRPRSGLALKHGISVPNTPGTIDSDYRGELKVILINHGAEPFEIHRGDRIAQLVLAPVTLAAWDEVAELDATRARRGRLRLDRGTSPARLGETSGGPFHQPLSGAMGFDRRDVLHGLAASSAVLRAGAARALPALPKAPWGRLAAKLGARLIRIRSPLAECAAAGGAGADALFAALKESLFPR